MPRGALASRPVVPAWKAALPDITLAFGLVPDLPVQYATAGWAGVCRSSAADMPDRLWPLHNKELHSI